MTAPNRTTLWARTLVEELVRHGLRHACAGSGSRSAPILEALAHHPGVSVHPHVDERSAAFFALGVATVTGTPAAVVTTSGTACANLFPAVIEASQSDIPLLLLTADRPTHLRGLDANQTIDQAGLFGRYPRLALDLPVPRARAEDLRLLRVTAARAWAAATGRSPGPVHLNVPLEKPLEPSPGEAPLPDGLGEAPLEGGPRGEERPFTEVLTDADDPADAAAGRLTERGRDAERPLVVCGPASNPAVGLAAARFAASIGAPLLADPLSGGRFGAGVTDVTVAWAEAILAEPGARAALAPDLVIRVGASPTSAAVTEYLREHGEREQIALHAGARWMDHRGTAAAYLRSDPVSALGAAASALEGSERGRRTTDEGWRERWGALERAAGRAIEPALRGIWFEGAAAAAVTAALPADATFFVGNSMPVRDVDAFAAPDERPLRTVGFRGASGIDGNVSATFGAAAGRGRPTCALIGDLTLLHDVGALIAGPHPEIPIRLVVIQNRGGGIFHLLPIRDYDPPFTSHVVMPHDVHLAAVARASGIAHRLTSNLEELEAAMEAGWDSPGPELIEVPFDRERNMASRSAVLEEARAGVASELASAGAD